MYDKMMSRARSFKTGIYNRARRLRDRLSPRRSRYGRRLKMTKSAIAARRAVTLTGPATNRTPHRGIERGIFLPILVQFWALWAHMGPKWAQNGHWARAQGPRPRAQGPKTETPPDEDWEFVWVPLHAWAEIRSSPKIPLSTKGAGTAEKPCGYQALQENLSCFRAARFK